MKKMFCVVIFVVFAVGTLAAADDQMERYQEQLREMINADIDPAWFADFAGEAARILLRERVTIRTMEIIRASIGRDLLPDDPKEAAEAYCRIAKEAEALVRRGESAARVAVTARVKAKSGQPELSGSGFRPGSSSESPGDAIRSSRAKDSMEAAKEKRSGNDAQGQGPK